MPLEITPTFRVYDILSERLWGPPSLLFKGHQGLFSWG